MKNKWQAKYYFPIIALGLIAMSYGIAQIFQPNWAFFVIQALILFAIARYLGLHFDRMNHLSIRDPLTGVYNRRIVPEGFQQMALRANKHMGKVTVIFVDIDRFKEINGTYGHLAGDFVLHSVADLLVSSFDKSDFVIRWGGDEFLVFTQQVAPSDLLISKQVREKLSNLTFHHIPVPVSISVGYAQFPDDSTNFSQLISLASRNMYVQKEAKAGWIEVNDTSE